MKSSAWFIGLGIMTLSFAWGEESRKDEKDLPIGREELVLHLSYLAGEELEGRKPGSEGSRKAAEYLIRHVKELGLSSPGKDYLQVFPIRDEVEGSNVAAFLEGSDPELKQEVVVVGAHRDHFGKRMARGALGGAQARDTIRYGADDNGSGTATLMEVAERLALEKERPKRSVLFLWFDAEELGLLGSRHYAQNPLVPLEKTVAMVNMDMVGRCRFGRVFLNGWGTSPVFSGLPDRLQAGFPDLRIQSSRVPYPLASDHAPFFRKNIPTLMLFTGLHSDYHRPGDTWEKIRFEEMAQIGELCSVLVREIADTPGPVTFAEVKVGFLGVTGGPSEEGERGFRIGKVVPDSPAQHGGLQAGDVILACAERPVIKPGDFSRMIFGFSPGEQLLLTVKRETKEVKLEVVLGARP